MGEHQVVVKYYAGGWHMSISHSRTWLPAALILMGIAPARGDGTITDGPAVFLWHDLASSATDGNADFRASGPASTDHLHQLWWWYRVESGAQPDTQEYPYPLPDAETYVGNQSVFTWHGLGHDGPSFDAQLTTNVYTTSLSDAARLHQRMVIMNQGANSLTIVNFFYLDADVGGTPEGDSPFKKELFEGVILRCDDGSQHVESSADICCWLSNWTFGTGHTAGASILQALNDNQRDMFVYSAPAPGDIAWLIGQQLTVAPGQSNSTEGIYSAINAAALTYCDTFSCPGDFNFDNRIDGRDIPGFSACLIANNFAQSCGCADMDSSGTLNLADLQLFVDKLLGRSDPNPACP